MEIVSSQSQSQYTLAKCRKEVAGKHFTLYGIGISIMAKSRVNYLAGKWQASRNSLALLHKLRQRRKFHQYL